MALCFIAEEVSLKLSAYVKVVYFVLLDIYALFGLLGL